MNEAGTGYQPRLELSEQDLAWRTEHMRYWPEKDAVVILNEGAPKGTPIYTLSLDDVQGTEDLNPEVTTGGLVLACALDSIAAEFGMTAMRCFLEAVLVRNIKGTPQGLKIITDAEIAWLRSSGIYC